MAAHLSIISNDFPFDDYEMKTFKKHIMAIKKHAQKGLVHLKGSFLFNTLEHEDYKLNENDVVFTHTRKIGKEFELFEVHFDKKENKLIDLFWVK